MTNKSSTMKFVEGISEWYTLPRNNNGIGKDNTVTSSRLLKLMGYKGQVLNSINYMGTRHDNNYQATQTVTGKSSCLNTIVTNQSVFKKRPKRTDK